MRVRDRITFPIAGLTATVLMSSLAFGQADWTLMSPAHVPPKRESPAMAQFGNASGVVMFGGLNLGPAGVFNQVNTLGDTWIWNGSDWTQITSFLFSAAPPPARFGASMAFDPNHNKTILFGGVGASGQILSDTWVFGSQTSCLTRLSCVTHYSWAQLTFAKGASPPGRRDASMAFDPSAGIVLTGGSNSSGTLHDTWVFDGSANTWAPLNVVSSPSPGRSLTPMAQCDSGGPFQNAMFFGGTSGSSIPLGDEWVVFPVEGNFYVWGQSLPGVPSSRFGHGMAYYPVSKFDVLYGGNIGFIEGIGALVVSDTWNGNCHSPVQWTQASPAHNPGPRWLQGMTTGPSGFKVVLFGGSDSPSSTSFPNGRDRNDTWTWGRRVACLPVDGTELPVGSEVTCQFDPAGGTFSGWTAIGFAPPSRDQLTTTFHTESPGSASITAYWGDETGSHSQTFNYTIAHPHH